jgi:hypothetical protein
MHRYGSQSGKPPQVFDRGIGGEVSTAGSQRYLPRYLDTDWSGGRKGFQFGPGERAHRGPEIYPWMSNCSGGNVGSLFTMMVFWVISSSSLSHLALLALSTLTTSG